MARIPSTATNVLFPNDMYDLMVETAAEEDRTVSWLVRRAMQEYLVNHGYLEIDDPEGLAEFCNTHKLRRPNGYKREEQE